MSMKNIFLTQVLDQRKLLLNLWQWFDIHFELKMTFPCTHVNYFDGVIKLISQMPKRQYLQFFGITMNFLRKGVLSYHVCTPELFNQCLMIACLKSNYLLIFIACIKEFHISDWCSIKVTFFKKFMKISTCSDYSSIFPLNFLMKLVIGLF